MDIGKLRWLFIVLLAVTKIRKFDESVNGDDFMSERIIIDKKQVWLEYISSSGIVIISVIAKYNLYIGTK